MSVLKTLLMLAFMFVVLVTACAGTIQGRAAFKAAVFVPQVLPSLPVKPQEWITRSPVREEIRYATGPTQSEANLYLPAGSDIHSAVVFFLGVVPPDRDERRIVALAEGLARSGMIVMIPWLETQTQNKLIPEDIDSLVEAFQYLQSHPRVDPKRIGMGGICTGASMAAVAAQDPRIRNDVRFINLFAAYYDGVDLIRAISSRSRFYDGKHNNWSPDRLTLELFAKHLIDGVVSSEDRLVLTNALSGKKMVTSDDIQQLTQGGRAVYHLIDGAPLNEIDALVEQLSPQTLELLELVSPSTHIDYLDARVLLMHDREDTLIPSDESRRFADAILSREGNVYHTEFSFFQQEIQVHVNEETSLGPLGFAIEAAKLYRHMYNVIRETS